MTCDPWSGLVPVEHGTGCVMRTLVTVPDVLQAPAWAAALGLLVVVGFAVGMLMVVRA